MAQAGDMGVTGKRVYTGWIREDQPNILLVMLSLLGASEASCVMGQSSVERPLGWVSCALSSLRYPWAGFVSSFLGGYPYLSWRVCDE